MKISNKDHIFVKKMKFWSKINISLKMDIGKNGLKKRPKNQQKDIKMKIWENRKL